MINKYKKLIYCIVLFMAFCVFTWFIKNFFKPFFIIILMLFLCKPIYDVLLKTKICNKSISAFISICIFNILILGAIFKIGNVAIHNFEILINTIKLVLTENIKFINSILSKINPNLNTNGFIKVNSLDIFNKNLLKMGATYTTEGLLSYFMGNIVIYFVLIDSNKILRFMCKMLNIGNLNFFKEKLSYLNKLIKIEVTLILISTLETILGFVILRIKEPVTVGILCGILDILPYVGTIFIFLPLIMYEIYLKQYIIAFGLACLYLLLTVSRQIMEAKFMSNKLDIHPLLIILSLYMGVNIFGLIGIFIGPLYIITAREIIMS